MKLFALKINICGDKSVGKTTFNRSLGAHLFKEINELKISVWFSTVEFEVKEFDCGVKFQIWNIEPKERYNEIRPLYYRQSLGALLIFDLTSYKSFEHLPQWIKEIRAELKNDIPILLIGNKSDLRDSRMVSIEEISELKLYYNLYYIELSAFNNVDVTASIESFFYLLENRGIPNYLLEKGYIFRPKQKITKEILSNKSVISIEELKIKEVIFSPYDIRNKTSKDLLEMFKNELDRHDKLKSDDLKTVIKFLEEKLEKESEVLKKQLDKIEQLQLEAREYLKQENFNKAYDILTEAKNIAKNNQLDNISNQIDKSIQSLKSRLLSINKKKIHQILFEEKLDRCTFYEQINQKCGKIKKIQEIIEKPKIQGFFMFQFPKDEDDSKQIKKTVHQSNNDYKKEIKKIELLIEELNQNPYININIPKTAVDLGIKTCSFCRIARSYDFGILLITPPNPNAFLEAGMFMSLGKRVILLKNDLYKKVAFDISPFFYIHYKDLGELEISWKSKILPFIDELLKYYLELN